MIDNPSFSQNSRNADLRAYRFAEASSNGMLSPLITSNCDQYSRGGIKWHSARNLLAHTDLSAQSPCAQRGADDQSDDDHGDHRGFFEFRAGGKIEHQQRQRAR